MRGVDRLSTREYEGAEEDADLITERRPWQGIGMSSICLSSSAQTNSKRTRFQSFIGNCYLSSPEVCEHLRAVWSVSREC